MPIYFFHNVEIFIQSDELDELDRITEISWTQMADL